jgi:hypothetical protein
MRRARPTGLQCLQQLIIQSFFKAQSYSHQDEREGPKCHCDVEPPVRPLQLLMRWIVASVFLRCRNVLFDILPTVQYVLRLAELFIVVFARHLVRVGSSGEIVL